MPVELERIRKLNGREERADRDYVLYWAQMNRRVEVVISDQNGRVPPRGA